MIGLIMLCGALCCAGVWSYRKAVADEARDALELDRVKAECLRVAALRGAALQDVTTCELCACRPDMLQLVTLYDDASWLCGSCARLFTPAAREAA